MTTKYDWTECTEDHYMDMLEVLPPAVWTQVGFLVGEPMDHSPEGYPRYSAFACYNGKHYECRQVMTAREFRAIKPAEQFGA